MRKSKASVINERMMLMVPVVSPPLGAVLLVRLEAASIVSSIRLLSANQPDSQSMQVSSWSQVERRLPPLPLWCAQTEFSSDTTSLT